MRYRFNETNIATGLIKELLKEFNLPMYTVYTEGKPIYPGKLYIKNSTIYIGEGSGDSAELVPVNDYIYNQKQINMTKNLVINSSVYDSYTHTYLGNYLRFMRDYNRLNLMPLYNCFNTETLSGVNQFISLSSGNTFEINTYNTSNTYYLIPIKFNEQYTIAIDSPVTYELACMIHTPSGLTDLSKELMADTYKKIPGSQFSSPYLFSTDFDATKYWSFENNLRLLIKLPAIASNSTITVLEGNYTASARCQNSIVSSFAIDDKNGFGIYPTRLSLLDMNDGVSYPFADRLLEYLSNNAIVPQEKITDNIGRLQRAVYNNSRFKGAYDIWDPQLRISLFNRLSDKTNKKNFYNIYREDAGNTPASKMSLLLGNTTQGASPTPEAPQEIHSVKGDNEIRVVGFNIWDEVTANGYYGTNGAFTPNASYIAGKNKIPLLPSTQYCITSLSGNLGRICFYNADGSFNSTTVNYVGATATKYTFTTNANVYYMTFDMRSGYGTTYKNDICINVSDTEKNGTYEPYKAQVYPINLDSIELNALGTYKDYFHKANGKWYLHKAIGSQVGSTAPNSSGTASSGAYRYNYATVTRFKEYTEAQGGASSHFTYNINYNAPSGNFYNTGGNIIFFCDIAPADIGAWAQENKPIFYGILATPTETEITDTTLISQLEELSKATGYDGETNIIQSNGDIQFDISNLEKIIEINKEIAEESKPIVDINENIKFIDTTPDLLSYGDKDVETFLGVAR